MESFKNSNGFRDDHTNIDYSCLCPKRGKTSNNIEIKGASTTYRMNGNIVEVLDKSGNPCEREKNGDGDFIDALGERLIYQDCTFQRRMIAVMKVVVTKRKWSKN